MKHLILAPLAYIFQVQISLIPWKLGISAETRDIPYAGQASAIYPTQHHFSTFTNPQQCRPSETSCPENSIHQQTCRQKRACPKTRKWAGPAFRSYQMPGRIQFSEWCPIGAEGRAMAREEGGLVCAIIIGIKKPNIASKIQWGVLKKGMGIWGADWQAGLGSQANYKLKTGSSFANFTNKQQKHWLTNKLASKIIPRGLFRPPLLFSCLLRHQKCLSKRQRADPSQQIISRETAAVTPGGGILAAGGTTKMQLSLNLTDLSGLALQDYNKQVQNIAQMPSKTTRNPTNPKKYDSVSTEKRLQLLKLVLDQKWTRTEACNHLRIKLTTGCLIIRTYLKFGRVMQKSDKKPKLTPPLPPTHNRLTPTSTSQRYLHRLSKKAQQTQPQSHQPQSQSHQQPQELQREAAVVKIEEENEDPFQSVAAEVVQSGSLYPAYNLMGYQHLLPLAPHGLFWFYLDPVA